MKGRELRERLAHLRALILSTEKLVAEAIRDGHGTPQERAEMDAVLKSGKLVNSIFERLAARVDDDAVVPIDADKLDAAIKAFGSDRPMWVRLFTGGDSQGDA